MAPSATGGTTAPPTMTTSTPPSVPDTDRAEFPTLAVMPAQSSGSAQRQHNRGGETEQDTNDD